MIATQHKWPCREKVWRWCRKHVVVALKNIIAIAVKFRENPTGRR
jgi:hypothetical protein